MSESIASFAYALWIERLITKGLEPWLVTFMFDQLPGPPAARQAQMLKIVERLYGIRITRVIKRPRAHRNRDRRPIWLAAPDLPIFKHLKLTLEVIVINDGLHVHAIVLETRDRDCSANLAEHMCVEQDRLYRRVCPGLKRIDVRAITHDVPRVTSYVLKQIEQRVSADGVLILPRTEAELRRQGSCVGRNSSIYGAKDLISLLRLGANASDGTSSRFKQRRY